jgi:ribosome maturation factor RimP
VGLFVNPAGDRLPDLDRLTDLAAAEADALGFALVRVAWFPNGTEGGGEPALQIMAERPDTRQLTIDDCAALSHRLSDRLDMLEAAGDDPVGEAYRLEVSSPGIDRPLTRLADFADWAGHEAKVELAEAVDGQKRFRGDLAGLAGEHVLLDERKAGRVEIPFAAIDHAKLVLTDRLIAASAPVDMAGVEEVEESAGTEDDEVD